MAESKFKTLSMTADQAAYELQMNPQVVRRFLREGRIPGRKVGKEWRISRQQLEDFLAGKEPRKRKK